MDQIDQSTLELKQFKGFFKSLKTKLEKVTREWNEDESNRDKTFTIFNQLTDAKDEMQESMKLMLERDGKLEEALVRGQQVQIGAQQLKKRST